MSVPDRAHAARCLSHIGFLRLSAYWEPLIQTGNPGSAVAFANGSSFDAVMSRYMFDHRLRSMLLEAFSYIEISIRHSGPTN